MSATAPQTWATRVRAALPQGLPLDEKVWYRRHRGLVLTLWAHAIAVPIFGIVRDQTVAHATLEAMPLVLFALLASWHGRTRDFRATMATVGLLTASGILVHFSGGSIEAHFHFFVMVTLIFLYQSWFPFLIAISYVIVHHGVFGTIDPTSVYNHPAAIADPWTWAGIHGAFILGLCVAGLVVWKRTEELTTSWEEAHRKLYEAAVRQRDALEINDEILQRLIVADFSFSQGDAERGKVAVEESLAATKKLVAELLNDVDIAAGKLTRHDAPNGAATNGSKLEAAGKGTTS